MAGCSGSQAGDALLVRPFGVEFEEAGEDFVADFVGPAVAPGLFLLSTSGFFRAIGQSGIGLVLVIEQELAGAFGEQVGPAVGGEDGGVHSGVQGAQALDGRERGGGGGVKCQRRAVGGDVLGGAPIASAFAVEGFQPRQGLVIGRVKEVVDFREAEPEVLHERRAELVILPPRRLQRRVRLEPGGERERLEAIGRGIHQIVLQSRTVKPCPNLMRAALKEAKNSKALINYDDKALAHDNVGWKETPSKRIPHARNA